MDTSYETQVDAADRCTWRSGGFLGAGTSRRERSTYLQCNTGLPGLVEPGYSYALGGDSGCAVEAYRSGCRASELPAAGEYRSNGGDGDQRDQYADGDDPSAPVVLVDQADGTVYTDESRSSQYRIRLPTPSGVSTLPDGFSRILPEPQHR